MLVQISKFMVNTNENVMSSSLSIDCVFDISGVSDFMHDRPRNVFLSRTELYFFYFWSDLRIGQGELFRIFSSTIY